MNFKAFQKKILSDILNVVKSPYLYCLDGDKVLFCNSGHSCIMAVPIVEVIVSLDKNHESDSLKRVITPKGKLLNILPCFEGKNRYLFVDETDKQLFFDPKLISYFVDKNNKLSDYDLKYNQNIMYFYRNDVCVGCVLRLRSEPISLNYQELLEAEMKVQENRR